MAERIRRPELYKDLMDELVNEKKVFQTLKDLMVFAASLGFKRDKRKSFDKSAEQIQLHIFSGRFDQTVINAIAVASSKNDPMIMSTDRTDERIRIFEEYACGGLEILQSEFRDGKISDWEDSLLTVIMQEQSDNSILHDITSLAT